MIIRFNLKIGKHLWSLAFAFGEIKKYLRHRFNLGYWSNNSYMGWYKFFIGIEKFGGKI